MSEERATPPVPVPPHKRTLTGVPACNRRLSESTSDTTGITPPIHHPLPHIRNTSDPLESDWRTIASPPIQSVRIPLVPPRINRSIIRLRLDADPDPLQKRPPPITGSVTGSDRHSHLYSPSHPQFTVS